MDILGLKQYDVRWSNARQESGHCLQNSHVSLTRSHIDCGLKRKDYPAIWKVGCTKSLTLSIKLKKRKLQLVDAFLAGASSAGAFTLNELRRLL